MKKVLFTTIIIFSLVNSETSAQVKIGNNPTVVNPASLLELESGNKGLLLPRLTDTSSITNPPQGMFMFNNTDTSLYFKRKGGWRRLSIGHDNYWKVIPEGVEGISRIFSDVPVTINAHGNTAFIDIAPLQTAGMAGNTLASFGNGISTDNIAGVSLVGNWPGIYFNSYYNSSIKSMAAGNAGNITMDESNNLGGAFLFKISGYSATPNTTMPNPAAQMILNHDGKLSLNTGSVPARAWFEQHGAVNNTTAIFGGEGSGVAIEEHFPSIGFNSYYNGSGGYKSIGAGYGGEIGIDQNNGDFYITTMNAYNALPDNSYLSFVRTFNIDRNGYVGINTILPSGQVEIHNLNNTISPINGLSFTCEDNVNIDIAGFNLSVYDIGGTLLNPGESDLVFQARNTTNGTYSNVANIDKDGNYHQTSDARFKKDIATLDKNDMLQKLLSLNPRNYHFIDDNSSSKKSYGFLAQDVEQVFPEFVNTLQGKKMLAYNSFIPVIVSAIQEQQQEIEKQNPQTAIAAIQKENQELKEKVSELSALLQVLQQRMAAVEQKVQ